MEPNFKVWTGVGNSGHMTLYLDNSARSFLEQAGYEQRDEHSYAVYVKVWNDGSMKISPRPMAEYVRRTLRLNAGRLQLNIGTVESMLGHTGALGAPWTKVSVAFRVQEDGTVSIGPPERRLPPRVFNRQDRSSRRKRSDGILFLGTMPDGTPFDFSLPMNLTVKLAMWLQQHDIEIHYEREQEEGT